MARRRLMLVGWQAADWKLIQPLVDAGQMPTVQRLLETGVSGTLATLEPCVAPMLWTSMATGKHAYHHGVHGVTEVDPYRGRVAPVSAATRECKTLWEMLGEQGLHCNVVNWFATQGERDVAGRMVSETFNAFPHRREDPPEAWPAPPAGTYWPETLGERMNALRVSPWDIEPDEILRLFVPEAHTIDQSRDARLWSLLQRLAETFSVHAAACHLLAQEGDWDFTAICYRALDALSREFMVFHPPRMPDLPERDFELYQGVMSAAYRLHDLLLSRLLHLAGPDTAVVLVSDHGVHSDHLRPAYRPNAPARGAVRRRPLGVFAAAGPGFAADSLVHGARLLDVTPTLLAWFGLPVGADMEGRVLREAFTVAPEPGYIPSWESDETPGEERASRLEAADQQAVLQQLVALGSLPALPAEAAEAAAQTRRENLWNLARACMNGGRLEQALPLLEQVYFEHPERQDYTQHLALCQFRLGLAEEAETTAQGCLEAFGDTDTGRLARARLAVECGRHAEALVWLEQLRDRAPRDLMLLDLLGQTLMRLRRWEACAEVCRTALDVDPDNLPARLGLARCALADESPVMAQSWALEAIGREYGSAQAHFLLGVALHRQALWAEAVTALRMALALAPGHGPARSYLASTLRELGQTTEAATELLQHSRVALDTRARTEARLARLARLRAESAARHEAWENVRRESRAAAARAREAATKLLPAD